MNTIRIDVWNVETNTGQWLRDIKPEHQKTLETGDSTYKDTL